MNLSHFTLPLSVCARVIPSQSSFSIVSRGEEREKEEEMEREREREVEKIEEKRGHRVGSMYTLCPQYTK